MNRFNKPTDVHQHVWPGALLDALRARTDPPRLRDWTLELAGEPAYEVDPADHDLAARTELARADGLQQVFVSLSSPLGIESLAGAEGEELLDAWHAGARALPPPFAAWASTSLHTIDPAALQDRLEEGFVGLQLPATAIADAAGYARVEPLLAVLERRGRPLFVHPGPVRAPASQPVAKARAAASESVAAGRAGRAPNSTPPWWPAVVDYVAQMHAAWFAFRAHGRTAHPRLRVCFAMLAGLAPLHGERFAARAGERTVVDPDVFLETSSYGPRAIDAVVRVTGLDPLVHGSDRPYAPPPHSGLGDAAELSLRVSNPARLLHPEEV